jgi:hypothetical protein
MKMNANKWLGMGLLCVSVGTLGGCYKHSYTVGRGGNTGGDPTKSYWQSHWLFGLIGESDVDMKTTCPSGNATIKDRWSFLNSIVTALVGVIYAPTTVEVYCGEGKTASLHLSPEQLRRIAVAPETMAWANEVSTVKAAELAAAIETYRATHKNLATTESKSTF